jgi:hypothetical protein
LKKASAESSNLPDALRACFGVPSLALDEQQLKEVEGR